MNKVIYIAIILLSFAFTSAERIQASVEDDTLRLKIPQRFFVKELAAALNSNVAGYVLNGDSQRLHVSNFRVFIKNVSTSKSYYNRSFISRRSKRVLYVDFDYKYYRRGWTWGTKLQFQGIKSHFKKVKWYTPWVTDSGWIGAPIFFSVNNWKINAKCEGRYVDWSSNNATTRAVSSLLRDTVEEQVQTNINHEIQKVLRSYGDLRYLAKHYGSQAIANAFGGSTNYVNNYFNAILRNTNLSAHIEGNSLAVKFKIGGRIHVENDSNKDIHIAITYKDLRGQWKTEYWWKVRANKGVYLSGLRTLNSNIYIYAVSTDQAFTWSGNDTHENVNGRKLGFKLANTSKNTDGHYVIRLTQ
ncbi:DUF1036 domain-containing protein [Candidatus Uabimicrobium amorphum]|uniref:Uncharacterized protein n=1 Tax=Uabimicrobium amorphum TaxID=2596890 RepID=A0A5S9IQH0_UABAM|nr:DUF1036 domain-containing protein [Candidatus Uabimicrobium amorphum]BBM86233.1 hypothetical protein UABAM_04619 [Candidatus Uabimicrobium amorphum]